MPEHPHNSRIFPVGKVEYQPFRALLTVRRMFSLLYYPCILAQVFYLVKDFFEMQNYASVGAATGRPQRWTKNMFHCDEKA